MPPYSGDGETPEQTSKIESCVSQVMAKGRTKNKAIAICKTAILGNAFLALEAASEEDILRFQAEIGGSDLFSEAAFNSGSILKFEGACLAVSEVNKNRDGISTEGIKQLAETIRLMPLTHEHEPKPRGVFTRGYTNEESTECLVDGFIWAGLFPSFAEEVRSGIRKLSIDAEADLAVCSICGAAFQSVPEYCEHMRIRNSDAVRWLFDLKAVAGGAVLNPAGTGTVFPGKEGLVIISHKEGLESIVSVKAETQPRRLPKKTKVLGGNNMEIKCPECGFEHEITTEAERLQAELDQALAKLEAKESELTDAQTNAQDLQATLDAEARVTERFVDLVATVGVEVAKEALPSLRKVDDETFTIMKSMASHTAELVVEPEEAETLPAQPPQTMIAAGDNPPDDQKIVWKVEL